MDISIFCAYAENRCVSGHIEIDIPIHTQVCTGTLESETKHGTGISVLEKSQGFYKKHSLSHEIILFERQMQDSNSGILLKKSLFV